jgi:hypothetical protein
MWRSLLSAWSRLSPWQRRGLAIVLALVVAFGVLVEIRSAFSHERKTDLGIYLRAAWAVRAGDDPYEFTTERACHYNYPPLLAILLVPLADPPAGIADAVTIPFGVSVAIWYGMSVLFAAIAVHLLANALEQHYPKRRWWALRIIPLVYCLPGILRTLSLGQADLLVLLLLCGTIAAALRRRSWQAGLWLSVAICVKLIPAFLLVYPLWRRDWRWLAGCALGLFLGLGAIPMGVLGPARAWDYQVKWTEVVVLPSFGLGKDHSRESDLTAMNAVNSQSLVGILHNYEYPDRATRPAQPSLVTRGAALAACAVLTLLTLLAAGLKRSDVSLSDALALGSLVTIMLLVAPVCHPHYLCHWLPLVTALVAWDMQRRDPSLARRVSLGAPMALFLAGGLTANLLTSVPGLAPLRDGGLATAVGLSLWALSTFIVWKLKSTAPADSRFALAGIPEYNAGASRKAS